MNSHISETLIEKTRQIVLEAEWTPELQRWVNGEIAAVRFCTLPVSPARPYVAIGPLVVTHATIVLSDTSLIDCCDTAAYLAARKMNRLVIEKCNLREAWVKPHHEAEKKEVAQLLQEISMCGDQRLGIVRLLDSSISTVVGMKPLPPIQAGSVRLNRCTFAVFVQEHLVDACRMRIYCESSLSS